MTTLWSKILETYTATFTIQETKDNWNNDQYGGRKGSSTDHVLISIWDEILKGLDSKRGEEKSKAVVLTGVEFSKSFSRCSHQEILKAYQRLGLSDWGIYMHASFLKNRRMKVKIGNLLSDEKIVTGGAVQGSVLGVLDHNAVLEFEDEVIEQDVYKYIDDLTLAEAIPQDTDSIIDSTGGIQTHYFRPQKTQESFNEPYEACKMRNLKINEKKTQLLSISNNSYETKAWIKLIDGSIMYLDEMFKILGFTFTNRPTIHAQVDYIASRAASRFFVIRKLAGIGVNKDKIKTIYCSIVRSIIEYSSITYGSMLSKYQSIKLENLQKRCLRAIYGYNKTYEELLQESNLKTLEERRQNA